jgi:hypothetical protein
MNERSKTTEYPEDQGNRAAYRKKPPGKGPIQSTARQYALKNVGGGYGAQHL